MNEDLNFENLNKKQEIQFNKYKTISEFPSSIRDISISFSNENNFDHVIKSVFELELLNLKDLFIFDFYNNKDKNILKAGFLGLFFNQEKEHLKENDIDIEMKKVFSMLLKIDGVDIPGFKII